MQLNNPALRLFNILQELKRANHNLATGVVLADAFGVSSSSPKDIFKAIVEFHNLVRDVIDFATTQTNLPSAPLLRYVPQIESAVEFTNLDAAWGNYSGRITTECLVVLEMVAHVSGIEQDGVASEEDLRDLQDELAKLFEFVSSDLSLAPEFKKFVLQQIEQIRRCAAEYRISGPQGFNRYLESLIGQLTRHGDVIKKAQSESPEAVSKLRFVLAKMTKFIGLTKDGVKFLLECKKAYATASILLPGLSSSGDEIPEVDSVDVG